MPTAEQTFRGKAPGLMALLMRDFDLSLDEAAAIMGNAGHESSGFTILQEIKPTVAGSRGGWGWFQWTGPRRRAFEAYCARNNLDPKSDKANYGFLFVELHGDEKKAIPAVKKAATLSGKVQAFERAYERAGVKHYPERYRWASIALDAYDRAKPVELPAWAAGRPAGPVPPVPDPVEPPEPPEPPAVPTPPVRRGWMDWLRDLFGGLVIRGSRKQVEYNWDAD